MARPTAFAHQLLLALGCHCGLHSLLHAQTFLSEQAINQLPSDVAVTPDGLVAIVRASSGMPAGPPFPGAQLDGLTAWSMADGSRITIQGVMPTGYGLGENQAFLRGFRKLCG